jgi:hypothetical protein
MTGNEVKAILNEGYPIPRSREIVLARQLLEAMEVLRESHDHGMPESVCKLYHLQPCKPGELLRTWENS